MLKIIIKLLSIILPLNLMSQSDPYLLKDFKKFNSELLSIKYTPDGKSILAGFNDGSARMISLETQEVFLSVKDHWKGVVAVDIDPKSKFFITAGDNTIKVWNMQGVLVHNMKDQTSTLWSAHLDASGKYLVCGAISKVFKVFDPIEGKKIHDYNDHKEIVMAACFSPDGKFIASASSDNTLKIRNFESGEILATLPSHSEDIYSLAYSNDGKLLASGSKDKTIRVYSVDDKSLLSILKGHNDIIVGLAFSPDGKHILSCSYDQTIRLWDLASGKTVYSFIDHNLQVTDICFSPDGKSFASSSMDKTIKIWDYSNEIFVNFYFEDILKNELSKHSEFLPRAKGETKSDYDKRNTRAVEIKKAIVDSLYSKIDNRP
jgi:WD40 repeat protein